jgi:hypothetical protein
VSAEPLLMVVGGGKPRGRRPLFGTRATERIEFVVTVEQREDIVAIAAEEGRAVAMVIRDAVNEYVGDFREKQVFRGRRSGYTPE